MGGGSEEISLLYSVCGRITQICPLYKGVSLASTPLLPLSFHVMILWCSVFLDYRSLTLSAVSLSLV